jgi:biotin operon repressor
MNLLKQVVTDLKRQNNVIVSSLSGMGLNTFIKEVVLDMKSSTYFVVNFYSYESDKTTFSQIENLLINKLRIDYDYEFTDVNDLVKEMRKSEKCLLVVLNKLDMYVNYQVFVKYFESLSKHSNKHVCLLISSGLFFLQNSTVENFERSINKYVFTGYKDDFSKLATKVLRQLGCSKLSNSQEKHLYGFTLGHVGLTVAVLKQYANKRSFPSIDEIMQNDAVLKRLIQVEKGLADISLNLFDLVNDNDMQKLEIYGLSDGNSISQIVLDYVKMQATTTQTLLDSLTKTEMFILQIIKTSKERYISIDTILNLLGESKYEKNSDWSIYKHINNINKKLKESGYLIINKRGVGYTLKTTQPSN